MNQCFHLSLLDSMGNTGDQGALRSRSALSDVMRCHVDIRSTKLTRKYNAVRVPAFLSYKMYIIRKVFTRRAPPSQRLSRPDTAPHVRTRIIILQNKLFTNFDSCLRCFSPLFCYTNSLITCLLIFLLVPFLLYNKLPKREI